MTRSIPAIYWGEFACGKTDPVRREVFEQYALAALRRVCFGDPQALAVLQAATNDARVASVVVRNLGGFSP